MCKKIFSIITAVLSLMFFSCSKKNALPAPSVKGSENVRITATFYPVYIMLLNITDSVPGTQVSLLAPPNTGCLHDYQLTTKDMKAIAECDILVANGAGMEDFLDKAMEARKGQLIQAAEGYTLIEDNPHVWVSPDGAAYETLRIAQQLASLDKKNADSYLKNAQEYVQKITDLSKKMHASLDKYAGTKIITFHEAFPYFTKEFALTQAGTIEREPGTEPTAKELAEVIALIKQAASSGEKIALFAEPQYSSGAAAVIAQETGLKVYELDPAVTGELDKDAYLKAMETNLKVLETAFTGAAY